MNYMICANRILTLSDKYMFITHNRQHQEELDELNEKAVGISTPEPFVIERAGKCSAGKLPLLLSNLTNYHHYDGRFCNGPLEHIINLVRLAEEARVEQDQEHREAPAQESSDGLSEEQHIPERKQRRNHWEYLGPYHGKRIRHEIGTPGTPEYSVKYGRYNRFRIDSGVLGDDGIEYSLSSFGSQHHKDNNRRPSGACRGTTECEIEVSDGDWVKPNDII